VTDRGSDYQIAMGNGKTLGKSIRPPPGSRARAAIAPSIPASSCTGSSVTVIPKDGAAAPI
jgi:hypothetical protein